MRTILISTKYPEKVHDANCKGLKGILSRIEQIPISDSSIEPGQRSPNLLVEVETDCSNAIPLLEDLLELTEFMEKCGAEPQVLQREHMGGFKNYRDTELDLIGLQEVIDFENQIAFKGLNEASGRFLSELEHADWLAHAGEIFYGEEGTATAPANELPNPEWCDVALEVNNRLSNNLLTDFPFHRNRVLQPLTESVDVFSLVQRKVKELDSIPFRSHEDLRIGLRWIVSTAIAEKYFEDLLPVGYGFNWSQWLLKGRIPCGWDVDENLLIIY